MSSAARRLRKQLLRRRAASPAARSALGLAGAYVGLRAGARSQRWIGPLRITARADLHPAGGTRIELPPLGTATLRTHRGPLRLRVTADDVDPSRAENLTADGADLRAALPALRADGEQLGYALAARGALCGLGGAVLAGGLPGAAAGAALLAAAGAMAARTAERDAWRDPQLTGLLTKLPLILGDLSSAPQRIDTYRAQLAELVRTGTDVYRHVVELPDGPPDDAIRLLHISDIHLSPVTFPLVEALVATYEVDAVVDTGDLVDWGTPPEQAFADQIGALGVPYVFVKGNHDSDGIAAAVGRQANATVLDVEAPVAEVAGLRFAGMADPRFTPDKTTGDDHAEHRVSERAQQFAAALDGTDVDVLLVHDPAAARALGGRASLLLAGHTHKRAARRVGGTVVLVQGASGGSGLRGVQHVPPTPVALSIVYVDRASKQVWGVDEVTLGGIGSVRVAIERRTIADLLGETDTEPVGTSS